VSETTEELSSAEPDGGAGVAKRLQIEEELAVPSSAAKKLLLDPNTPLAAGLGRALERILQYAVASAQRVEGEPKKAVHDFRKSIRRARALVKLSRPFLNKSARKELEATLKAAVAPTSLLRDIDVLIGHVGKREDASPELRGDLESRLRAEREARNLSPADVVLGVSSDAVAPLGERYAGALPDELARRRLSKALRRSYKAARHALAEARGGAGDRDEAIHDFRKRVKELRYQLELLRGLVSQPDALARQAELAEALGAVTDLLVLRSYVEGCQLDADDAEPLLKRLGAEIELQRTETLDGAAEFFAPKPKTFVKALLGPVNSG
jgi:CHAD domain-containing protein